MLNMKVMDYRITSDTNQVTVSKVRRGENGKIIMTKDKDGNEIEAVSTVGWYASLEMALKGIQKHHTLGGDTEIQTIKDYRKALSDVQKAFANELEV